jgi:predicted RNase H-like nuclease (RuvC/YqgF family)
MERQPMTDTAFVGAVGARPATATALKASIEVLQAEIANLEALMAAHQTEFRTSHLERDRAEQLLADLLRMTADLMSAREAAARLAGELSSLRSMRASRPWWSRMLGRCMLAG